MYKGLSQKELYQLSQTREIPFSERPLMGPASAIQEKQNTTFHWAIMGDHINGYEYTKWWHESRAVRETAFLGDWSWLEKVHVKGADAFKFMNYLSPKNLTKQKVNQIYFTPMCNDEGKMVFDGTVYRLGEDEYMYCASPSNAWFNYIQKRTGMDVILTNKTHEYCCYQLQGPKSLDILEKATGEDFHDLKFSWFRWTKMFGFDVMVARQGVSGELGVELMTKVENNNPAKLWEELSNAGGEFGLRILGMRAQRVPHIEAGIGTAHMEYNSAIPKEALGSTSMKYRGMLPDYDPVLNQCTPTEMGWGYRVDLDEHDFVGKAALQKEAEAGGPARKLVGLIWNSEDVIKLYDGLFCEEERPMPPELPQELKIAHFLRILRDGKQIGWQSSPTYSVNLKRMISFGRIDKELANEGEEVIIEWRPSRQGIDALSCEVKATITSLPFIKRKRARQFQATKN